MLVYFVLLGFFSFLQTNASSAKQENETNNLLLFDLREQSTKDQERIEQLTADLAATHSKMADIQRKKEQLEATSATRHGDVEKIRGELAAVQEREKTELASALQSVKELGSRTADLEVKLLTTLCFLTICLY